MILPVSNPLTLRFTADGTSTAFTFDLAAQPLGLTFNQNLPAAILVPIVTSTAGTITNFTTALSGTTVTITFATAPAPNDGSGNLLFYTLSFAIQY